MNEKPFITGLNDKSSLIDHFYVLYLDQPTAHRLRWFKYLKIIGIFKYSRTDFLIIFDIWEKY